MPCINTISSSSEDNTHSSDEELDEHTIEAFITRLYLTQPPYNTMTEADALEAIKHCHDDNIPNKCPRRRFSSTSTPED
jgi:hypothetical protein